MCYNEIMLLVVVITLIVDFVNWLVLKELRTDFIYYPESRKEQAILLCLLLVFDFAALQFFKFLSNKFKNVFQIFMSTTLLFLSLLALHDIILDFGEENLILEFLILGITLAYLTLTLGRCGGRNVGE